MSGEPVKSAADFPSQWASLVGRCGRAWRLSCAYGVGLLIAWAPTRPAKATEKDQGASLLFGGAVQPRKAPIRLDPVLPRGELRDLLHRHSESPLHCSLVRPVCVDPSFSRRGLQALERAYEEHIYGLSLPGPGASFRRPLVFSRGSGGFRVERWSTASRGFDRAKVSCSANRLDLELARRCVFEAAVGHRAPATASWLRQGYAAHVALELGAAPDVTQALAEASRQPQVGVLTSTVEFEDSLDTQSLRVSPLRSARFFSFLDHRSSAPLGHSGFLALLLGATRTPAGAPRFDAEPDLADVLSATLEGDASAIARFFDEYAQYSFFHPLPGSGWVVPSRFHRAEMVDWSILGKTLPRSVVLPRPIEPTGSSYVLLELTKQQREQMIAVQTHCESPVSYVWSVVRLNEAGERVGSYALGYKERGTSVEARIEPMSEVSSLLFVGTNMGGVDMAHPFDPDHEPHEAHGCRVYLSVLPTDDEP